MSVTSAPVSCITHHGSNSHLQNQHIHQFLRLGAMVLSVLFQSHHFLKLETNKTGGGCSEIRYFSRVLCPPFSHGKWGLEDLASFPIWHLSLKSWNCKTWRDVRCVQGEARGFFSSWQKIYLMNDRLTERSHALHLGHISSCRKLNLGKQLAEARKLMFKVMKGFFDLRNLAAPHSAKLSRTNLFCKPESHNL